MGSARKRALVLVGVLAGMTASQLSTGVAGAAPAPVASPLGFDATADLGSLHNIERIIGADELWKDGYTGAGVDVALIDTGVTPVPGLDDGQVIDGPDLSFDTADPDLRYLDSYGHGTHMAGIIAGRDAVDPAAPGARSPYTDADRFDGVAPDARIVNVKVGATDGAVDVSQVIAGIDWVVAPQGRPGPATSGCSTSASAPTPSSLPHRPARLRRASRLATPASSSSWPPATTAWPPRRSPTRPPTPTIIAVGRRRPRRAR